MDHKNKKLGILLFNGPDSEDIQTVIGLSYAAIKAAIDVEIFLMYEGVLNASYGPFTKLCDRGVKVTVCNHNADELKAFKHDKFKYGSQYDNAYIANETDRYITFI